MLTENENVHIFFYQGNRHMVLARRPKLLRQDLIALPFSLPAPLVHPSPASLVSLVMTALLSSTSLSEMVHESASLHALMQRTSIRSCFSTAEKHAVPNRFARHLPVQSMLTVILREKLFIYRSFRSPTYCISLPYKAETALPRGILA
jgi:hypothetical protein